MASKFLNIFLLFLFSAAALPADEIENPIASFKTAPSSGTCPFAGEKLEYDITWSFMPVGKAFISVENTVLISSGVYACHIVSEASSSSFVETLFPVKDRNEALLSSDMSSSYGYYKKISEGKTKKTEWVLYDLGNKRAYGEEMKEKREKKTFTSELPSDKIFDILSALYVFRLRETQKNEIYQLDVNTKKSWKLSVKNIGREKVTVPAGKFKCKVLEPDVGEEGIFVPKKNKRLFVYISEKEKIPVMLRAEVFIGSVTAKLVKFSPAKNNP